MTQQIKQPLDRLIFSKQTYNKDVRALGIDMYKVERGNHFPRDIMYTLDLFATQYAAMNNISVKDQRSKIVLDVIEYKRSLI